MYPCTPRTYPELRPPGLLRAGCSSQGPKGRGGRTYCTYLPTHVAGLRHTSSFGGLCSRALSYLVSRASRLPSRLLSFRSFGFFNQCVRTCARVAQDRQFDPSRRDAAIMGAPAHMGLDMPWVAQAHHLHLALCSSRPNNTYIQRSLAMPSPNSNLLLVFMTNSRDTIHTCLSYLKSLSNTQSSHLCVNNILYSLEHPAQYAPTHPQPCLLQPRPTR